MDIDLILSVFNRRGVRYLLIGGVNFLLRHKPVLTFDVDFWIEDLKRREEIKRDRNLTPGEKWRLILQSIRWAESQVTVRRNTPVRCLEEQARKLAIRCGGRLTTCP